MRRKREEERVKEKELLRFLFVHYQIVEHIYVTVNFMVY
jgi:hypothetical protein